MAGLSWEPRAGLCEQMLSRPSTFQGIAWMELHRMSCQQLCLSCRLTLVPQSWLLLFFSLSVSFLRVLIHQSQALLPIFGAGG